MTKSLRALTIHVQIRSRVTGSCVVCLDLEATAIHEKSCVGRPRGDCYPRASSCVGKAAPEVWAYPCSVGAWPEVFRGKEAIHDKVVREHFMVRGSGGHDLRLTIRLLLVRVPAPYPLWPDVAVTFAGHEARQRGWRDLNFVPGRIAAQPHLRMRGREATYCSALRGESGQVSCSFRPPSGGEVELLHALL